MRVFELARELNIPNQEVIAKLREQGVEVTNHMSSIDEGQARKLRSELAPTSEVAKADTKDERIKKTVIRRRVVRQSPEEVEAPSAAEPVSPPGPAEPSLPEAVASVAAVAETEASESPAMEEPLPEDEAAGDKLRKSGARIVDRIEPPPKASEISEISASDDAKKPKRRIVAKRMYRPSKAEEKTLAKIRQSRQKGRKAGAPTETQPLKAEKRKIRIEETITVGDLAKGMGVKAGDIIKKFIEMGMMVTINQAVDPDTAGVIASEYGYEIEQVGFQEEDFLPALSDDDAGNLTVRPPVVTVMGHVDHGKTSILDAIRHTKVAAGEAGGITQHIGAYQVATAKGLITFLDTPGHEAFTAMRARGAQVTDIVILVVAANDGVMPQTREAVQHARAANVPIVVAINKCDLPEANPERVKQQLSELGVIPEEWGGDAQVVNVSAHTKQGLDDLLDAVIVQAEMMELTANPERSASGVVIESRVDKGRGPVATVIVQNGTLKRGDIVVSGTTWGRVRALITAAGEQVDAAGPSTPVEVLGLSEVPPAGEPWAVVENERIARQIAENRERKERERELHKASKVSLESIYERIQEGEVHELQVVLKADVQGSMEAVVDALKEISGSDSKVRVRVVSSGVGAITENDVNLAAASGAVVIGFNTRPDSKASRAAQEFGVEIQVYQVIYDLIDEIKAALQGMLAPESREESLGWAKVLQTFPIKNVGTVCGSKVESGQFVVGKRVRLVRDGQVLYSGKIANLRRFQDDVKEVPAGQECGILLENFNKVRIGDELECFDVIQVERVLGKSA